MIRTLLVFPLLAVLALACDEDTSSSGTGTTPPGSGGAAGGGGGSDTAGGASQSGKPIGHACKADAECGAELSCLSRANASSGTCEAGATICTRSCTADADCAGLADRVKCAPACDKQLSCLAISFGGTIGETCDGTKACASGLTCEDFLVLNGGDGCKVAGRACSKKCDTDADCGDLGPNVKCFGCGGTHFCGKTG